VVVAEGVEAAVDLPVEVQVVARHPQQVPRPAPQGHLRHRHLRVRVLSAGRPGLA
jgi:hypothetical protein